jgi:hypothetical protein
MKSFSMSDRSAALPNAHGQRPECEQREHPVRCTVKFGCPAVAPRRLAKDRIVEILRSKNVPPLDREEQELA